MEKDLSKRDNAFFEDISDDEPDNDAHEENSNAVASCNGETTNNGTQQIDNSVAIQLRSNADSPNFNQLEQINNSPPNVVHVVTHYVGQSINFFPQPVFPRLINVSQRDNGQRNNSSSNVQVVVPYIPSSVNVVHRPAFIPSMIVQGIRQLPAIPQLQDQPYAYSYCPLHQHPIGNARPPTGLRYGTLRASSHTHYTAPILLPTVAFALPRAPVVTYTESSSSGSEENSCPTTPESK